MEFVRKSGMVWAMRLLKRIYCITIIFLIATSQVYAEVKNTSLTDTEKKEISELFSKVEGVGMPGIEKLLYFFIHEWAQNGITDRAEVVSNLFRMAEFCVDKNFILSAEATYKKIISIQKQGGGLHGEAEEAFHSLGHVYYRQRRYVEAASAYENALAIAERFIGPEHKKVADNLTMLGDTYSLLGRLEEAEPTLKKALAIREKVLGQEHPDTANTISRLGDNYLRQARYSEAESAYKKALAIYEKIHGPEHQVISAIFVNLGENYFDQNRYSEAESAYKKALAITEKISGPEAIRVADISLGLGNVFKEQARYSEAESAYKKALAIYEKLHGPEHRGVADSFSRLGGVYRDQARYSEAESAYKKALAIGNKTHGMEHHDVAYSFFNLGNLYRDQARYSEAESAYKKALAIYEKIYGPEDQVISLIFVNLGETYIDQNRYSEAESAYKKALAITEKISGPEATVVAEISLGLGRVFKEQARYSEAESAYKKALAIYEKLHGPETVNFIGILSFLGSLYTSQARYSEAEATFKHALAINEKVRGLQHPDVASSISLLGGVYHHQARYSEAESAFKRALAITEKAVGPEHPLVLVLLSRLGSLYNTRERLSEAESTYKRALAIAEKAFGPQHLEVGHYLERLGDLYGQRLRFSEALSALKKSLSIVEKNLGPRHPRLAVIWNNLGAIFVVQDRYDEAMAAHKNSKDINVEAFGPKSLAVASSLENIAFSLERSGLYQQAEEALKEALSIREQVFDVDHPMIGVSLIKLGNLYRNQARYTEAEKLLKRGLKISKVFFGPGHFQVMKALRNMGDLYMRQGLYEKAEKFLIPSLGAQDDLAKAFTLKRIAKIRYHQKRFKEAFKYSKRAYSLFKYYLFRGADEREIKGLFVNNLLFHLTLGLKASQNGIGGLLNPDMFEVLQLSRYSRVANTMARMGARFASGSHVIADLIRKHQDISAQGKVLEQRFEGLLSMPPPRLGIEFTDTKGPVTEGTKSPHIVGAHIIKVLPGSVASAIGLKTNDVITHFNGKAIKGDIFTLLHKEILKSPLEKKISVVVNRSGEIINLDALFRKDDSNETKKDHLRARLSEITPLLKNLNSEIKEKFPRYAALTGRAPLSLSDTQKLLGDDEALVTFAGSYDGEKTHVFLVRNDAQQVYTADLSLKETQSLVKRIRRGITPVSKSKQLPAFDVGASHALYKRLLGPAEETLKGVRHLIVVPDGPLMSIPFGVLATGPGDGTSTTADAGTTRGRETSSVSKGKTTSSSGYKSVPWLFKKYALTMLPSIASLKSLRLFARKSTARDPFIGFGDPLLEGDPQKCKDVRGGVDMVSLFRGGVADVGKVRELCPLPKTSDELREIASFLKADKEEALYLGERATETMVKKVKLDDSKVIAFATHGLLSMQTQKLGSVVEPALVLTPPDKATEEDDGLLTASEIAQLKMNADFVILSACNTAAGGEGNAEGLSGLAKAFFYAGARSLLVSHWPVESKAAAKLTTTLFKNLKDNPSLSRAEAFRRSMMSLAANDNFAHPFFWAPFSIVGEGR